MQNCMCTHQHVSTPTSAAYTCDPQVPCEETVVEIRERYLELNWHSKSYTVKALVRNPESRAFEFVVSRGMLFF